MSAVGKSPPGSTIEDVKDVLGLCKGWSNRYKVGQVGRVGQVGQVGQVGLMDSVIPESEVRKRVERQSAHALFRLVLRDRG